MNGGIKKLVGRFVSFFLANIPGTLVDLGICWLLSTWVFHNYFGCYVVSPVVSSLCGSLVSFYVFYKVIWRDRVSEDSEATVWKRLLAFLSSTSTTFMLRIGLIQLVQVAFLVSPVVCNLVSMVFSGILNFVLDDKLVFKKTNVDNDSKGSRYLGFLDI